MLVKVNLRSFSMIVQVSTCQCKQRSLLRDRQLILHWKVVLGQYRPGKCSSKKWIIGKSKVILPHVDSVHFVQEPLQLRPDDKYWGLTCMQVLNRTPYTNIIPSRKEEWILSTMGVSLFYLQCHWFRMLPKVGVQVTKVTFPFQRRSTKSGAITSLRALLSSWRQGSWGTCWGKTEGRDQTCR